MKKIKKSLVLIVLLISAKEIFAQNTGINTKDPGSTLTVNGSFAADYKTVTTNTTLGITDYYTAYNGSSTGVITLPAAISGTGNFKGRVYGIKNTSTSELTIVASGTEKIDGSSDVSSIIVPSGYYVELISKGTTTGSTWELSMLVTTTVPTMTELLHIASATPQGALSTAALAVNGAGYSIIPGSSYTFSLPVARPLFLNVALGLDDLSTGTPHPYFRCELYIDGVATGLFQIVQENSAGSQMQFNMAGVRTVSAGTHTIDVRMIRWHNNGFVNNTNQNFGILSFVLDAVYMN
ncbi:hypothetical protein ACR777_21160 [Sphingobacterium spiritivorum]|uniref:hypothetical protein n=1 Tax=Sphingobacterium spiritivorum TaxID=258 RepID=UPI003DA4C796